MSEASRITVLLVDDHAVVREGYRRLLEQSTEIEVVGEAGNSADAHKLAGKLKPAVVVMDISLPDVSGIEAMRRLPDSERTARYQLWRDLSAIILHSNAPKPVPLADPELAERVFRTACMSYSLPEFGITLPFKPTDFTQVNPHINRVLVDRAVRLLAVQPDDRVIDWFCGLGNFTLPLATRAREVLGIEGSETLVQRAHLLDARCEHAWRTQRPANDWAGFLPNFREVVRLSREEARLLDVMKYFDGGAYGAWVGAMLAFWQSLPPAQRLGVLVHELLHCSNKHHARRCRREPTLWNVAADLAINPLCVEAGFTLPEGALLPGRDAHQTPC